MGDFNISKALKAYTAAGTAGAATATALSTQGVEWWVVALGTVGAAGVAFLTTRS